MYTFLCALGARARKFQIFLLVEYERLDRCSGAEPFRGSGLIQSRACPEDCSQRSCPFSNCLVFFYSSYVATLEMLTQVCFLVLNLFDSLYNFVGRCFRIQNFDYQFPSKTISYLVPYNMNYLISIPLFMKLSNIGY